MTRPHVGIWPRLDTPQGMCLDKGYDYDTVRVLLTECDFTPISARQEQARAVKQEADCKARRWVVECNASTGTPGTTRQWRRVHEGAHQCQ